MARGKRTRPQRASRARKPRWHLVECYTGSMLGFSLSATRLRAYAREYPTHRQRMLECLAGLGAKVELPIKHKQYVANHEAIVERLFAELGRVSRAFRLRF